MKDTVKNGNLFLLLDGPAKIEDLTLLYIPFVDEKIETIAEKICAYAQKYNKNVRVVDNNFGIVNDSEVGGFSEEDSTLIATPASTPEEIIKMYHRNCEANNIREGVLSDRYWNT